MLCYFMPASFGICIGWSNPGSALFTCREICTVNVIAQGACGNFSKALMECKTDLF